MTVTPFEVFVRLLIIAVLIMIALVGGDGTTDVEPARPLTLKNMRELGVQHPCSPPAQRPSPPGLDRLSMYSSRDRGAVFKTRVKCGKCGGRGNRIPACRSVRWARIAPRHLESGHHPG